MTLQFIPPGTDLKPILPALANVFDQVGRSPKSLRLAVFAAFCLVQQPCSANIACNTGQIAKVYSPN